MLTTTQVSSRHPVWSGEPGTSTLRSVQHYQSLNLSSPRVASPSGNRRSFQHLQHPRQLRLIRFVTHIEIGRIKFLSVCDQGMLPRSHSCLGRKRLGRPRQVPRRWQASLRQGLYPVVTGSVLDRVPFSKFACCKSARVSRVVLWCCKFFSTAV